MNNLMTVAIVDRIESKWAVLLVGEDAAQVVWPADKLPAGTAEGSVLSVEIRTNPDKTAAARNDIGSLIDRTERGD